MQRAFLGVRLDEEFDDAAARQLRLNKVQGARVVQIYGDTPAEVAGLQIDDVVLTFDGQKIEDQSHLIHLVSLTPVNKTVRMEVLRSGSRINVDVRLTERKPSTTSQTDDQPGPFQLNSFSERRARPTGLTVVTLDESLSLQVGGRPGSYGVLVTRCSGRSEDSDALLLYDVIEEAGRQPVRDPADLERIIADSTGPLLLKVSRTIEGVTETRLVLWKSPDAQQSE